MARVTRNTRRGSHCCIFDPDSHNDVFDAWNILHSQTQSTRVLRSLLLRKVFANVRRVIADTRSVNLHVGRKSLLTSGRRRFLRVVGRRVRLDLFGTGDWGIIRKRMRWGVRTRCGEELGINWGLCMFWNILARDCRSRDRLARDRARATVDLGPRVQLLNALRFIFALNHGFPFYDAQVLERQSLSHGWGCILFVSL